MGIGARTRTARSLTSIVALAAAAACGGGGAHTSSSPSITEHVGDAVGITTSTPASRTGTNVTPGAAAGAGSPTTTQAKVHVRLLTDRGVGLAGIRVTLTGSSVTTATSGTDGDTVFSVPVGPYRATVDAGCAGTLFVQHAGSASVPAGLDVRGRITLAAVRRVAVHGRSDYFRVSPPRTDADPGNAIWHVGQVYAVSFATTDRCTNKPAAGQSFASTSFVAGRSYRVVAGAGGTTGADGRGQVQVSCTAATDDAPSLIAAATIDDRDAVDLLSTDTLEPNQPTCQP